MNEKENLEKKLIELFSYIKFQVEKVKNKQETKEGAFNRIANYFERVEIIRKNKGTTPIRDKPSVEEGQEILSESYKRLGIDNIINPEDFKIKKENKSLEEYGKDDIQ